MATSTTALTNKTHTSPVTETITGSTITLVAGDNLDAGGADVTLKDDSTTFVDLTVAVVACLKSGSTPTTAVTFSGAIQPLRNHNKRHNNDCGYYKYNY